MEGRYKFFSRTTPADDPELRRTVGSDYAVQYSDILNEDYFERKELIFRDEEAKQKAINALRASFIQVIGTMCSVYVDDKYDPLSSEKKPCFCALGQIGQVGFDMHTCEYLDPLVFARPEDVVEYERQRAEYLKERAALTGRAYDEVFADYYLSGWLARKYEYKNRDFQLELFNRSGMGQMTQANIMRLNDALHLRASDIADLIEQYGIIRKVDEYYRS